MVASSGSPESNDQSASRARCTPVRGFKPASSSAGKTRTAKISRNAVALTSRSGPRTSGLVASSVSPTTPRIAAAVTAAPAGPQPGERERRDQRHEDVVPVRLPVEQPFPHLLHVTSARGLNGLVLRYPCCLLP